LSFHLYDASDIFFYNYNKETKVVDISLHYFKIIIKKNSDDTSSIETNSQSSVTESN